MLRHPLYVYGRNQLPCASHLYFWTYKKKKKKGNPSDVFILCAASKTGAFYMTFVDLCGRKNKISDKFDFKSENCRKLKFMKNRGTILYFIPQAIWIVIMSPNLAWKRRNSIPNRISRIKCQTKHNICKMRLQRRGLDFTGRKNSKKFLTQNFKKCFLSHMFII